MLTPRLLETGIPGIVKQATLFLLYTLPGSWSWMKGSIEENHHIVESHRLRTQSYSSKCLEIPIICMKKKFKAIFL